ncbi:hypothetical protein FT663_03680 [Candidozyma haemuli var. vulneris]|uniref:Phosphatidylethanolamine N-methyltransferase n=1 Tax=Candidozyma haemuli TaxID=45357 RepID=A0A2V1ASZ2_9ASCO|nr:hypothetical protein CXQ85_004464 [[Candida] haemuloni]KAF3987775.1 hypothetical protein FT662_03793 [[Candida] haemuloni var. vulneris]KAF3989258.1 hypothetical protein FT663_03680 [[Candida] haemuloni var. vulneris]PVH20948.1 hypothetical protein CXQ85_004464 [[Candida] haemuloni]
MAQGITFRGETFAVPETHDMVKTLFDPTVRKSVCEVIILVLLASNGLVFLLPSADAQIKAFIALYVFWRFCYNFGIGYLLNQQSNRFRLVEWARKYRVFDKENKSGLANFVRLEIRSQMGAEYDICGFPVDFNTWLIFRKVVDLILMSDFTTFVCLVVACCLKDDYQFLHGQPVWAVSSRIVVGVSLILFNLWVKINAHNTIKDYAWYWGDFFFRQINNEDLIFDGVFEMFPHPMYSVGYIGYYGFALIAKSYTVLVVALFGHFLQMVFLHFIENPHIDKIYGPSANENSLSQLISYKDLANFDNAKPLVGLANFNLLRASDVINLINCVTYSAFIPILASLSASNVSAVGRILFYLTVTIKVLESVSINSVLVFQSEFKTFTRWYLSNNVPVEKSLNNFAVLYNSFINLTYASFIGMNLFKVLTWCEFQHLFFTDYLYLRIFMGVLLVITQVWINTSIVDSIGYFGWFYGDFFIPKSSFMPQRAHLTKAGVYRYLNNPEQVFGVCGVMGATLMLPTFDNLVICLIWVVNNFVRINFIEKNHMIKIYGEEEVYQDSGVTKTVKKHLLPESIEKKLSRSDSQKRNAATTSLILSFDSFMKELRATTSMFSKQNIADLSQNKYFANSDYHLEITGLEESDSIPYKYVGQPVKVNFTAPSEHSAHDWVGLYKVTHTTYSRYRTLISSNSRWDWTGAETTGSIEFSRDKLFWEEGLYEFRYHIDGKHDVGFISSPFEIKVPHIPVPTNPSDATELAQELNETIFSPMLESSPDINTPIYQFISKTDDIVAIYTRVAQLIAKSTGVKVSKRFLIYNDNESGNKFTIYDLAAKLVSINNALSELSVDEHEQDLQDKKTQ